MTRRVLSRTCVVSKDQVSHERADSNRKHYPSIISHEEQPTHSPTQLSPPESNLGLGSTHINMKA